MSETTCAVCHRSFRFTEIKGRPKPEVCGQVPCRARHEWGDEDWAGKARMASARKRAGIPLTDLDHEALARYPQENHRNPEGCTPSIAQGDGGRVLS